MEKILLMIGILSLVVLTGCVQFEDESVICKAMFENGKSFNVPLNETAAESCREYSKAIYMTGICKGYIHYEEINKTCIMTWTKY